MYTLISHSSSIRTCKPLSLNDEFVEVRRFFMEKLCSYLFGVYSTPVYTCTCCRHCSEWFHSVIFTNAFFKFIGDNIFGSMIREHSAWLCGAVFVINSDAQNHIIIITGKTFWYSKAFFTRKDFIDKNCATIEHLVYENMLL